MNNPKLAETLLLLWNEIRDVDKQLKILRACVLASSPKPAEFQAHLDNAEKMYREINAEDENKVHQFEALLEMLKTGKSLDSHDA